MHSFILLKSFWNPSTWNLQLFQKSNFFRDMITPAISNKNHTSTSAVALTREAAAASPSTVFELTAQEFARQRSSNSNPLLFGAGGKGAAATTSVFEAAQCLWDASFPKKSNSMSRRRGKQQISSLLSSFSLLGSSSASSPLPHYFRRQGQKEEEEEEDGEYEDEVGDAVSAANTQRGVVSADGTVEDAVPVEILRQERLEERRQQELAQKATWAQAVSALVHEVVTNEPFAPPTITGGASSQQLFSFSSSSSASRRQHVGLLRRAAAPAQAVAAVASPFSSFKPQPHIIISHTGRGLTFAQAPQQHQKRLTEEDDAETAAALMLDEKPKIVNVGRMHFLQHTDVFFIGGDAEGSATTMTKQQKENVPGNNHNSIISSNNNNNKKMAANKTKSLEKPPPLPRWRKYQLETRMKQLVQQDQELALKRKQDAATLLQRLKAAPIQHQMEQLEEEEEEEGEQKQEGGKEVAQHEPSPTVSASSPPSAQQQHQQQQQAERAPTPDQVPVSDDAQNDKKSNNNNNMNDTTDTEDVTVRDVDVANRRKNQSAQKQKEGMGTPFPTPNSGDDDNNDDPEEDDSVAGVVAKPLPPQRDFTANNFNSSRGRDVGGDGSAADDQTSSTTAAPAAAAEHRKVGNNNINNNNYEKKSKVEIGNDEDLTLEDDLGEEGGGPQAASSLPPPAADKTAENFTRVEDYAAQQQQQPIPVVLAGTVVRGQVIVHEQEQHQTKQQQQPKPKSARDVLLSRLLIEYGLLEPDVVTAVTDALFPDEKSIAANLTQMSEEAARAFGS